MSEREQPVQNPAAADRLHRASLDLLAEYATALTLGQPAEQRYPSVAAHLAACAHCRNELAALLAIVGPIYAGEIAPAQDAPRVDLAFLAGQPDAGAPMGVAPGRLRDDRTRLVVILSEAVLALARRPALAAAARGEPLFRYTPEPQPPANLRVTVEVFAGAVSAQRGTVEVLVDAPARNPLDQGGIIVRLTIGGQLFEGRTGETGAVSFADVPVADLVGMRIEVEVPDAAAPGT